MVLYFEFLRVQLGNRGLFTKEEEIEKENEEKVKQKRR